MRSIHAILIGVLLSALILAGCENQQSDPSTPPAPKTMSYNAGGPEPIKIQTAPGRGVEVKTIDLSKAREIKIDVNATVEQGGFGEDPNGVGGTVNAKGDSVWLTACSLASMANEKGEITYDQIMTFKQHIEIIKGTRDHMDLSSNCSGGTGWCRFLCKGEKITIVGIPDGCHCFQTLNQGIIVLCTNDCPDKQYICITSVVF